MERHFDGVSLEIKGSQYPSWSIEITLSKKVCSYLPSLCAENVPRHDTHQIAFLTEISKPSHRNDLRKLRFRRMNPKTVPQKSTEIRKRENRLPRQRARRDWDFPN